MLFTTVAQCHPDLGLNAAAQCWLRRQTVHLSHNTPLCRDSSFNLTPQPKQPLILHVSRDQGSSGVLGYPNASVFVSPIVEVGRPSSRSRGSAQARRRCDKHINKIYDTPIDLALESCHYSLVHRARKTAL